MSFMGQKAGKCCNIEEGNKIFIRTIAPVLDRCYYICKSSRTADDINIHHTTFHNTLLVCSMP